MASSSIFPVKQTLKVNLFPTYGLENWNREIDQTAMQSGERLEATYSQKRAQSALRQLLLNRLRTLQMER